MLRALPPGLWVQEFCQAELERLSFQLMKLCFYLLLFLGFSCAYQKPVALIHPDFYQYQPHLIAVLPMDNMSPDLDATPLIRPIVQQRLIYKGYRCLPLERVDQLLKENGVMVSHDVYMFSPQELGKILKVDSLVYGIITDFNKHYAVIYSDIIVGISLEMKDAQTGEVLWKSSESSSENTLLTSLLLALQYRKPEESLAAVIAYNVAFEVLTQYRPYAENAVRKALSSLPDGPYGAMPYPWDEYYYSWQGDIVELWINTPPLIPTYSPKMRLNHHSEREKSQHKEKTSPGKTKNKEPQNHKPMHKKRTGTIINLNPIPREKSTSEKVLSEPKVQPKNSKKSQSKEPNSEKNKTASEKKTNSQEKPLSDKNSEGKDQD